MKKKAFTLVELLVVIVMITLLVFILKPALGIARSQSKVTVCQVSLKQTATATNAFEGDNDGKLPVHLNRFSTGYGSWAKYSFLSIALRDYVALTCEFGTGEAAGLSFNGFWGQEAAAAYTLACVSEFYICPFVRRNRVASSFTDVPDVIISGNGVSVAYDLIEWQGYSESYSSWLWPAVATANGTPGVHPYGDEHGKPKYQNLNWYNAQEMFDNNIAPFGTGLSQVKNIRREDQYPTISDKTLLYCTQGEWLVDLGASNNRMLNYQSHAKGKFGGSSALFGDSHVEWVQGSQIGWP